MEPYSTTVIIIAFLVIWAIIIPVISSIPKIGDIISFRYMTLVVFLAVMLGVIINYHDLDASIKMAVIVSTAILSGIYILVRSVEKVLAKGWTFKKDISASVSKGDIKAEVKLSDNKD